MMVVEMVAIHHFVVLVVVMAIRLPDAVVVPGVPVPHAEYICKHY